MKPLVKRKIPLWVWKKMPNGIERLNTIGCRYYFIWGLCRELRDWEWGGFHGSLTEGDTPEYILDLDEKVYWFTGK